MFGQKKQTDFDPGEVAEKLRSYEEQCGCLRVSVRTLLYLLKAFPKDIAEIDSDGYKKRIDKLVQMAESQDSIKDCNKAFESEKTFILSFIDREKKYVQERDAELKGIIEFLRKSLSEMIGESREFSGRMHERNVQMERISGLDDIRKIKEGLKLEVGQMRQAILDKERKDSVRYDHLAKEVGVLKSDLQSAREAAMTDKLTGAKNRLSFDAYMTNCIERFVVAGERFSVLMCDIDDFKKVNDTYGHQIGDSVLKVFVRECRAQVREEDFLARYGGEEFAIVFPAAPLKVALKRAQKICSNLAANQYLAEGPGKSHLLRFTASIGVAEVRTGDTVESVINRADQALYTAKKTGKNKAVSDRNILQDVLSSKAA